MMPSRPCTCRSPKKDSSQPEKGKRATGAGTPILMPIMPHSTSRANLRAAPPSCVKSVAALPKGRAVKPFEGLVERFGVQHREHRSKEFVAEDIAFGVDLVDERRADEETVCGHVLTAVAGQGQAV